MNTWHLEREHERLREVELGEERDVAGTRMFGVASGGEFYAMAKADELKGLR